ncbi:EamA/RhaT family transporter [Legionella taurinensis]|uniref:DMT family transporter n=1 Tax=Legionella taurinensis TaxID=70611 RepID=A0A3A5LCA6_9GAMM|nr:DMT family transporter [Legionella taurinensis]MDX1836463.1 DMT family transporter [Legionella taurinensis]PUT43065.1 multidrug ABC transporter permease [Legionella taurinensis]PUT45117.1 multidrug ABC transporter permease [Legionella taurinensis]PUT45620.1 multidrug ABC transporter permease [Legionella taurinensis]PUT49389.1 multidrug ABC transporter permease [Legionella taurinensis]
MNSFNSLKALMLLILLGFIWGSGYSLARYAMTHDVPPLGYSFWQALGPAIILTLSGLFTKNNPLWQRQHWPYFFVCGLSGIAIPNTNMYFIASHLPAGLLAVLVNTVPLLVYPLALVTRQERFDRWRILALLMGVAGIVMIIAPGSSGLMSGWTLLALISPLGFALCSIYIGVRQPAELNAIQAASGMLLAASLLLTPLVIQQHAFYSLTPPFTTAKQVIILEILLSSAGYFIFFKLIRLAGPVFYSLTGGVVALTGLFWGFVIFAEVPNSVQQLAMLCVIAAIFLLSWRQSRQTREVQHVE